MACYLLLGHFFWGVAEAQTGYALDSLIYNLDNTDYENDSLHFEALFTIATKHSNPTIRINFAKQAIALGKANDNIMWLRRSTLALGYAYKLLGNLEEALTYQLEALNYANLLDDESLKATSYNAIAGIYRLQENYALSLEYYHKSVRIFRDLGDTLRLATTLMNSGELFRFKKSYDSAISLTKHSENLFRRLKHEIGIAYCQGNLGLSFAETGRVDSAENYMNKAIATFSKSGNTYPISVYQISLADIYSERGDFIRARNYAHQALEIGLNEGLKEQIRDASLKLSELYEANRNFQKAYNYQSQYITYRDSINNEETIRKMADLRTEYEVSKKQAEVDLKQAEVDLLNEQARNQQIVLWSVIVILVLVMGLTYALLKFYRVKVRAIRIVRKRREIITAQRNQLAEVNQTKDKFFSIISHDIRGPISNFQGVSQLIQLLVESNDKEALLKLSSMLDKSSKEISDLLDNLLEWAMSQQGRMPYKPEEIKLHELCNSNLAIMKNLAAAKKISINQKVKEKATIQADKNSVSTIIRNLISNAVKFTPEGGKVQLSIGYEVNLAVIIVEDTGIGISKDKLNHLFEFKGERSRWGTEGEKGVGLGLTLVHEFVELNKGKIEVESVEGKGTVFKVYLPLLPY